MYILAKITNLKCLKIISLDPIFASQCKLSLDRIICKTEMFFSQLDVGQRPMVARLAAPLAACVQ